MVKRIYVLEYDIEINPYSPSPKKEHRVETFMKNERDGFIKRYLEIKDKFYMSNIETGYAEPKSVDMDKVINAI